MKGMCLVFDSWSVLDSIHPSRQIFRIPYGSLQKPRGHFSGDWELAMKAHGHGKSRK